MVTLQDISNMRIAKARANHEIYKEMYYQCKDSVVNAAGYGKLTTTCYLSPFVPGKPLVNVHHAARYIRDKLTYGGFGVETIPCGPCVALKVSWQHSNASMRKQLTTTSTTSTTSTNDTQSKGSTSDRQHTPMDITDDILEILSRSKK